jgi:hypothetical protein
VLCAACHPQLVKDNTEMERHYGRGGAFRPAPGAVSGAGGQGGRRIPEGRIAGAVIRDRGGGGVAAAMA